MAINMSLLVRQVLLKQQIQSITQLSRSSTKTVTPSITIRLPSGLRNLQSTTKANGVTQAILDHQGQGYDEHDLTATPSMVMSSPDRSQYWRKISTWQDVEEPVFLNHQWQVRNEQSYVPDGI
jgi:hypothetical protein